jgi:hypothetical protein
VQTYKFCEISLRQNEFIQCWFGNDLGWKSQPCLDEWHAQAGIPSLSCVTVA